ncbi:MAG: DNA polymerase III subunit beta [Firmicutes bacterium]|nr:DNA polymerase III subunit beta [Bacillota bacterium]
MRLSLPKALLADHLQIVAKAIPTKNTITGLDGILFESNGENLILTATNHELGIQTQFSTVHKEVAKVVLPGKVVEIIRRLPGDSVQISVNPENYLTDITSGQAEFQVYGLNADDYPVFPTENLERAQCSFKIVAGDLRRALRQTLFAVSHDEGKPAFTGILFSLNDNTLALSSSDTFRLATTSCSVENSGSAFTFLVPGKTLQEVIRIFSDDAASIVATVMQNQLFLTCEDIRFSSRLLDENFPNIERVVPKEFIGQATIDAATFAHAVDRAALLSEGTNHVIRLSIGDDIMVVRASSKHGKIQEQLPLSLQGEGVEIALNSRFVLDMLKINEGDQCSIEITGANKPCIMRDSLYPNYLYLVLPIKI